MDGCRACFADLQYPRQGSAWRHEQGGIAMLAFLAMVSGAETWIDMALSGRSKEPLRHRSLRLPDYLPSHDTTLRVFRLLDPATFEALLARYADACSATNKMRPAQQSG